LLPPPKLLPPLRPHPLKLHPLRLHQQRLHLLKLDQGNLTDNESVVPEAIQKKRARDQKYVDAVKAKREQARKERVEKRKLYLEKGKTYYEAAQKEQLRVVDAHRKVSYLINKLGKN
jgi:hypothetical protein